MADQYPAQFYHSEENGMIGCDLCPHNCIISDNETGICKVRKNIDGKLYSLNYGTVSSLGIDPVEKKPLYHFHPRAEVLSLGSWGCNLACSFCQNWQISQQKPQLREFKPAEIVEAALEKELIPFLDAANIDLKAFNNDFYQEHCHGGLESVKETKKYLDHVYLGNAVIKNTADTYCSSCGNKLIERNAYHVKTELEDNYCPHCGKKLYGKFNNIQ